MVAGKEHFGPTILDGYLYILYLNPSEYGSEMQTCSLVRTNIKNPRERQEI
jgi:hypothetical protein